jgi:hypothetical protein
MLQSSSLKEELSFLWYIQTEPFLRSGHNGDLIKPKRRVEVIRGARIYSASEYICRQNAFLRCEF